MISDEDLEEDRRLAEAHFEPWARGEDDLAGYSCQGCGRELHLLDDLDPIGLCGGCADRAIGTMISRADEIIRLRAEVAKMIKRQEEGWTLAEFRRESIERLEFEVATLQAHLAGKA